MTIWANCIVHNEENFLWFALMSVVDHVDMIVVWDTGSTDKTVEIIKEVIKSKGKKIVFKEVGRVDGAQFTEMRQAMLDESQCDWILVLDGDEVWWEESIKAIKEKLEKNGGKLDAIAVPFYNLVGDIYHYQSSSAGRYKLLGRKGHLTIRAINKKIPGLHWSGPYGNEGLMDGSNTPIQNRDKVIFLDYPFLHFTHLNRTAKKNEKYKYDLGIRFPKEFGYPEVLHREKPALIPLVWTVRGKVYELISWLKVPCQILWRAVRI